MMMIIRYTITLVQEVRERLLVNKQDRQEFDI
jgi:hypothetical protein